MSSAPGVVVITRDRRRSLLHVPGRPAEESEPTRSSSWTTGRATAPRAPCAARSRAGRRARGEQRRVGAQRGVEALDGEVVAFADDDSWWAAGALARVSGAVALAGFATATRRRGAPSPRRSAGAHVVRARRPVPSAAERDLRLLEVAWHAR